RHADTSRFRLWRGDAANRDVVDRQRLRVGRRAAAGDRVVPGEIQRAAVDDLLRQRVADVHCDARRRGVAGVAAAVGAEGGEEIRTGGGPRRAICRVEQLDAEARPVGALTVFLDVV